MSDDVAAARGTSLRRLRRTLAGDIDTIVGKALHKQAAGRYATAAALADDLARHRDHLPIVASPASALYRISRFVERNAVAVSATAIVMLTLAIGAGVALWQARIATQQSVRAAASTDFIVRLFQSAGRSNPGGAAAGDTTARRLLQLGGDDLLRHAGNDPRLELDLSLLLSRLNLELDLIDPASGLAERAVSLARTIDNGRGPHVAEALLQNAEAFFRAGRYVDAIRTAEEALPIAQGAAGNDALRAHAHLLLGASQHQLDYARTEPAQKHLETALALLKSSHATGEDRSRAAFYLAFIAESRLDFPPAEALYRDGIEAGVANFGERSFIVAFGYENLADLLRKEHRLAEARDAIRKALDIYSYVLGTRHGTVAFARTNLALIEADSGHRAEAEELLDSSVKLAQEVFGEHARQVGFPALHAARLRAQRGELEAAARAYETTLDVFVRNDPPSSRSINGTRIEYAAVLTALGRLADARRVLEQAEADLPRTAAGGLNDVPLLLTRAQLDYARGDARAGLARIDEALALMDREPSAPDALLVRVAAVAARCGPDRAHAEDLLARLRAHGLLASPDPSALDLEYQARLTFAAGQLQLATDHPNEASSWLARAVAQREALDDPRSPWLAEARRALELAQARATPGAPR
jgi:eukaryotic-like serine/threonine-protein kinase